MGKKKKDKSHTTNTTPDTPDTNHIKANGLEEHIASQDTPTKNDHDLSAAKISELEDIQASLEKQLEERNKVVQAMSTELTVIKVDLDKTKGELTATQHKLNAPSAPQSPVAGEEEVAQLKAEIQTLKEIVQAQTKTGALAMMIAAKDKNLRKANATIEVLEEKLRSGGGGNSDTLQGPCDEELLKKLHKAEETAKQRSSELSQLQAAVKVIQSDIETKDLHIIDLSAQLQKAQLDRELAHREAADQQTNQSTVDSTKMTGLKNQLDAATQRAITLTSELQNKDIKINSLYDELSKHNQQVVKIQEMELSQQRLTDQFNSVQKTNNHLQADLLEKDKQFASTTEQWKAYIDQLQEQLQQAQGEQQQCQTEIVGHEHTIQELQSTIKQQQHTIQQQAEAAEKAASTALTTQPEPHPTQPQPSSPTVDNHHPDTISTRQHQQQMEEFQQLLNMRQQQIQQLAQDLRDSTTMVSELQKTSQDLQVDNATLQENIQMLMKRIEDLTMEREEAMCKMRDFQRKERELAAQQQQQLHLQQQQPMMQQHNHYEPLHDPHFGGPEFYPPTNTDVIVEPPVFAIDEPSDEVEVDPEGKPSSCSIQ